MATIATEKELVLAGEASDNEAVGAELFSMEGSTYVSYFSEGQSGNEVRLLPMLKPRPTEENSGIDQEATERLKKTVREKFNDLYKHINEWQVEVATNDISDLDFIAVSRLGLANRGTTALMERLGLTAKETAQLLTLSPRTYHRKSPDEVLNPVASERLLLLTRLADHGLAVFEDQGKFNRWLRRPLRILGSNTPLSILDTGQGIKLVDTILSRMEYGVYS